MLKHIHKFKNYEIMKKIILLLMLSIAFFSCSSDDGGGESYAFKNATQYVVTVKNEPGFADGSPDFQFNLSPGESKNYTTNHRYSLFAFSSTETERNFSYNFQGNTRVIYDFGKMVEYKITGTAASADITYSTSNGGTFQKTVSIPHTVGFDYFGNDFKYISAQNNGQTGSVRVEIYIEDSFVAGNTCASAYCIASVSN